MSEYKIEKEESVRIDILKFIAIIFVVFIHSYTTDINFAGETVSVYQPIWLDAIEFAVSQVISRCGVPLFFILSAVLLFRKQRVYLTTLRQKVRTLLIPYLIWNSFWIAIFFFLQSLPLTVKYFSGSNTLIKDRNFFEWLQLYGIGDSNPQDYPLWFVRDLMVVTLFFPIIEILTKRFPKIFLCSAIFLLLFPVDFPFKAAILWTIIGACAVKLQIRIKNFDNFPMAIVSILYILIAAVLVGLHLLNVEISWFSTLFVLLGIIFWIMITKYIYGNSRLRNVFVRLANWTFIIYVAHELTLSCIKKVCFGIVPNEPVIALFLYFAIPFLVVFLCIVAGRIGKCFAPKLYQIATGSRG